MIDRDRARDQRLEIIMAAALKTWPSDVEPDDTPATVSLTLADAKRIRQLVQTAEDYRKALAWQEWAAARDEGRAEGLGGEWVMVPREPTYELLRAMSESVAVDDEGPFPPMFELLDFSGENKTYTVLRAAYAAMLAAAPPASQTQEG